MFSKVRVLEVGCYMRFSQFVILPDNWQLEKHTLLNRVEVRQVLRKRTLITYGTSRIT